MGDPCMQGAGKYASPQPEACGVFLGGSCNPTTWRQDIAIPILEKAGCSYYNPQVEDWHEGLIALEATAKAEASVLLFVIDSMTRALASMLEAAEFISSGRHVVLVIQDIEMGARISGDVVSMNECKDLNRARHYLRDIYRRHIGSNVTLCEDIGGAVVQALQVAQCVGRWHSPKRCTDHAQWLHKRKTSTC